jgi:PIN domain nuclease of toxin-antitoxin system
MVTPCEIAIKTGSGKLNGAALLVDFEKRESAVGFSIANLTVAQAIRSGLLPRHHRDPFDRLLIAQALDLNIPILSSDGTFDLYGVQRIWE